MQSSAAIRSLRLLPSARTCLLPFARVSTTPFKTADPAVHSQAPQEEDAAEQEHSLQRKYFQSTANEPVKTPPFASSTKFESTVVGPTANPTFQQKRRWSHAAPEPPSLYDVSCVGADGSPLDGSKAEDMQWKSRDEQVDEEREYYEHHKASPLSEIEFADTRTDGEKREDIWGGEGRGYLIRDTVDDSLRRAEAMFNAARETGDPCLPHSRALMRKIQELNLSA